MKRYTIGEITRACEGRFLGDPALLDAPASDIVIDSRKASAECVYVPIKGARFDGHAFINAARQNGAAVVLSEHALEQKPYILVDDTLGALQRIASAYRDKFTIPVVGLTGSAGKTSTKEMIAFALTPMKTVVKTQGNENNETGAPLTLFRFEPFHEAAIVEMGTNHFGEIDRIAAMVKPTICLITNIGVAHIEHFGSREGVFRGKTEMLAHKKPGARVIVNGDDDLLATLPDTFRFGLNAKNDLCACDILDEGLIGMSFTARYGGMHTRVHVPTPGMHAVYNALSALAVGIALDLPLDALAQGISAFIPVAGRMSIRKGARCTVLNDAYNANPASMMAAVDVLSAVKTRRVCIMGDMLELGEQADTMHEQVGVYAAERGLELIVCVGALAEACHRGAARVDPARTVCFPDQESLLDALPALIQDGDTVLVKASRGMQLERTVERLLWLQNPSCSS